MDPCPTWGKEEFNKKKAVEVFGMFLFHHKFLRWNTLSHSRVQWRLFGEKCSKKWPHKSCKRVVKAAQQNCQCTYLPHVCTVCTSWRQAMRQFSILNLRGRLLLKCTTYVTGIQTVCDIDRMKGPFIREPTTLWIKTERCFPFARAPQEAISN